MKKSIPLSLVLLIVIVTIISTFTITKATAPKIFSTKLSEEKEVSNHSEYFLKKGTIIRTSEVDVLAYAVGEDEPKYIIYSGCDVHESMVFV